MPQILIDPNNIINRRFSVIGSEAHHVVHVLRKTPGDEVELFDGRGSRYRGRLTHVSQRPLRVEGEILEIFPSSTTPYRLHLFQGLPKGSKFDFVVEKATELGVDRIVPFFSDKNPNLAKGAPWDAKWQRWKRLAEAASKQSNRSSVPIVEKPQTLKQCAPALGVGTTYVFWEKEFSRTFKKALSLRNDKNTVFNIVIGPEAGFSEEEVLWLIQQGGISVGLGPRPLRTETAGMVALALLNYELEMFL